MRKWAPIAVACLLVAAFVIYIFNPFKELSVFSRASEAQVPVLTQISKGAPVFASSGDASMLSDNNYGNTWLDMNTPAWAAYNLNAVPVAQRQNILVSWHNASYAYTVPPGWHGRVPRDFVIEGSRSTGSTMPTDWQPVLTVTNHPHPNGQHIVDFAGYNWFRFRVTRSGDNNTGVELQELNLFDASAGTDDSWLFLGDSLTADFMRSYTIGGTAYLSQLVSQRSSGARYPVMHMAGIPYITASQADDRVLGNDGFLKKFPGKFVVLGYGTNDAASGDYGLQDFDSSMRAMAQAVIAAGKVPLIPKMPYAKDDQRRPHIEKYNAKIDQIYRDFPQVVKGPDFYAYFKDHQDEYRDDVHMNDTGMATMRKMWADVIFSQIYSGTTIPSPGASTPTAVPTPNTGGPTAAPTPATVDMTLNVNPANVIRPFGKEQRSFSVAGWDMEKRVQYPGDSQPRTTSLKYLGEVPKLAELTSFVGFGIVRYAGGGWSNFVGWDRANKQVSRVKWTQNGNTYDYRYSAEEIDSLAAFSKASGMDVMIEVNVFKNDPAMWADMVKYANVEKKYGFKYWELGNENDLGSHQLTPQEYASRTLAYTRAMKAVDPSIQIVAGVPSLSSSGPEGISTYLYETVNAFRNANVKLDVLSYHWYQTYFVQNINAALRYRNPEDGGQDNVFATLYGRRYADTMPANTRRLVLNGDESTKISITELNVESSDYGNNVNKNHFSALWFSDILGRNAYAGADQQFIWLGYSMYEYGSIEHDGSGNLTRVRSPFYPFVMYSKYFGDRLVESSSPDNNRLSVWGSVKQGDNNTLYMIVTNLTDSPIAANVNLNGFVARSGGKYVLAPDKPLTTASSPTSDVNSTLNGRTLDPNNIASSFAQIQPVPVTVSGTTYRDTFAPLTATAVVLSRDPSAPIPTAAPTTIVTRTPTPSPRPSTAASATPIPTSTGAPTPTSVPPITRIPSQDSTVGINLNGPAVSIDGVAWKAGTDASVSVVGNPYNSSWFTLSPAPVNADMKSMLTTGFWGGGESPKVTVSGVDNGDYQISLYIIEDDGPQTFSVQIEGTTVATGLSTGDALTWKKLGPYTARVSDGTLNVNTTGGAVLLSGIVYAKEGAPELTAAPSPTATRVPSVTPTRPATPTALPSATPRPSSTPVIPTATRAPTNTPVPTATRTPSQSPTRAPTTASQVSVTPVRTTVSVYAYGTPAGSSYPTMRIEIYDLSRKQWITRSSIVNVAGPKGSARFRKFNLTVNEVLSPNRVRVSFVNDAVVGSQDRNLAVDRIELNGVPYQSEQALSTGTFGNSRCGGQTSGSEWLHCNGYFEYR
jgi:lysophospholipase L1-like esterase